MTKDEMQNKCAAAWDMRALYENKGEPLKGGWEAFKCILIPEDASETTKASLEIAYYSGAVFMNQILVAAREDPDENRAREIIGYAMKELHDFAQRARLQFEPTRGNA